MQPTDNGNPVASSRRVMLVMMSLSTLYNYLYSMTVSSAYGLLPVLGGALYMSGAVATAFAQTYLGENRRYMTRRMRVAGTLLLAVLLLFSLVIFSIYPVFSASPSVWGLFWVVLALTMRAILGRRLVGNVMLRRLGRAAFAVLYAALQIVPACALAPVFFQTLPRLTAWQTLGGYGLSVLLEGYTLFRERHVITMEREETDVDEQTARRMSRELTMLHAYSAYQRLHMFILMALQITLVMVYTFIGITTGEIISCLALSVGCTIIMREGTDFILSHLKRRKPALLQLLLFGLFLWMYGLVLFYRQLDSMPNLVLTYLTLGLCSSGLSVSVTCLAQMELDMTEVAEYGLQNHMQGYDRIRSVYTECAILLGQLVALLLLAILCLPSGIDLANFDFSRLLRGFRPLMVLPPLLLLVGAIVSVLHFPMNNRHFEKLKRFLTLNNEPNPALKKQLDEVVVAKHKNRFGVKLLVSLIRPFYYHKVLGRENAAGYEDGTMVLVCNHGELYGPIVTNLYVPISFRPWTINKMMDRDAIVRHIYENSMVRQKWLPSALKLPLTKLIAPICIWAIRSLEAIPVYRDNPRALMKTFRQTVEAMQAGDNILLFPERDQPDQPGQRGYTLEGVGELYTGFAMIAPAFYAKTHQSVVFLPIYASKQLRTLTIGKGVLYRPQAPATDEKMRIVNTLSGRMEAMYAVEHTQLANQKQARLNHLLSRRGKLRRRQREELAALARDSMEMSAQSAAGAAPPQELST